LSWLVRDNRLRSDLAPGFTFNPASQIASVSRSDPGSSPGQADAYVWTGHYNVVQPYAVNGLNQYTSAGSAAFGHDTNGNLMGDGLTSFTCDVEKPGLKPRTYQYEMKERGAQGRHSFVAHINS
jgi:hypothetical protein